MTPRAERIFHFLLRIYPAEFRDRYGRAMRDFHRDRLTAARLAGDSIALLWLRTILDTLRSAAAEHLHALLREDAVTLTILQDLAYAVRGLLRRPGFTAIVVATMALGIGANAAIFTVVNAVLLQPLPYAHPEQLVTFGHEPPQWLTSAPDFIDYHRELRSFTGLAAYTDREATLTNPDSPERLRVVRATEDFFPVLGVKPLVGRTFLPDEYASQQSNAVVLSYGLWQRRFGGDRSIVGRTIPIDGVQSTVVGVMPPRFAYPRPRTDLWMPLPRFNPDSSFRGAYYLFVVGRLAPNVTIAGASVEASGMAKRIMHEYANLYNPREPLKPKLSSVRDKVVGASEPYLLALLGAVGFVLLIACANVANLLLVRSETRHREMAVRSALGASRFRLLVQLLTESILLDSIGGALALLLAWLGDRALVALAPGSIPRLDEIRLDWRVVLFTATVALTTGIIVGLVPGIRASRDNAADTLKESGRATGGQRTRSAVRHALVVAELALAVITLAGTSMLVRSLWNLEGARLGFEPRGVLAGDVALPGRDYDDAHARLFYEQLLTRLRSVPGVVAAGAAGWLPVVGVGGLWPVTQEGHPYPPGQAPQATPQQITPGYLGTMGIPLLAGRDFTAADRAGSVPVVIVSKRLGELFWPNENPIGRRMRVSSELPFMTVVGVVGDFRSRGFDDTPEPTFYLPYSQTGVSGFYQPSALSIVLRTRGDPTLLAASLRDAVHALDRTIPVSNIRTMEEIVGTSVANRRFSTMLLAGFAALALLLAGIGTYGVISYGVTQRSFEIGVRMALGAGERSVLALVMSEGLRMSVIGLGLGLVASVALGRGIRALLVGVPVVDAPTLLVASGMLLAVALIACVIPARRATTVSPIAVIRGQG